MTPEQAVADRLKKMVADPRIATAAGLRSTLRLLAKWRSRMIDQTVVAQHGTKILAGPFRGMHFVGSSVEANISPKLLGSYETELHSVVEEIIAAGFERIIDIGCADGYYAVGFAFRMPRTEVFAFDVNAEAQKQCRNLAERNGVGNQIRIGSEFRGTDFELHTGYRSLVFMDIEGGESDLLRPDIYPALRKLSVLVECHDAFRAGLSDEIMRRFEGSHDVRRFDTKECAPKLPPWFSKVDELDRLLAGWEWRVGPTPWLYLTPTS